jgi:hypothetical protein
VRSATVWCATGPRGVVGSPIQASGGGIVGAEKLIHSRDQAIFVDQATDASLSSDAILLEIDRFG